MKKHPNIHIDRIRVLIPCKHQTIGKLWFDADEETGEIAPAAASAMKYSDADSLGGALVHSKVISKDGTASYLFIDCCPPLILQPHNVFGHSILSDYVYAVADLITRKLGIKVCKEDRKAWRESTKVTGIHITASFNCPAEYVEHVIDAIDANTRKGKHRDEIKQIALGFTGKRRSKYHVLSIYYKWDELQKPFGPNPGPARKKLLEVMKNAIRAEVKLYSQFLSNRRRPLQQVSDWDDVDLKELYFEVLDKYDLQFSIRPQLTVDELTMLTSAEQRAYQLWLAGVDVYQQFTSRTTRLAHIKNIKKKTGIDIGGRRRPDKLPALDLREIFCSSNLIAVPEWLKDSPYFWRPKKK